ncbi:hypothetical protein QQF64_016878, partial [Cirrhinus molitorella]
LRDQSNNIRREVLFEIQELGRVQEELSAIQQNVLSLLTVLQSESAAQHLQEVKVELVSQKAQLQDVMDRVQKKWSCVPSEIQVLQNELNVSMQEAKDKLGMVMETSGPLCKMSELLGEVTVGLNSVQTLLKQTSPNFSEAESTQKRIWDELDQWHTRIAELEAEVQDLAEQKPERAHILMDRLTEPLQLYQTTAKQAEQRTALISKIPACLQEYDGIVNSSSCWLREAQSWLIAPRTYTTAKCIHCHANSLKMMLDESEGYRAALEDFLPALQEITPVFDTSPQQQLLQLCMQNITLMQQSVLDPLSHLQHSAAEMDAIEAEVKTMENNITKIRTILSATDTENISPEEDLENIQVILDNVQSMKRTIDEIESCRPGLGLPAGAEQTLTAFHWAQELLQPIQELQQLSVERSTALRASIGQPAEIIPPSDQTTEFVMPHLYTGDMRDSMEGHYTEEEDEDNRSSSSGTVTCSIPEDPDLTTVEDEDFKTEAASAVTERVTKESSSEEVDFPAIKHVIQDADNAGSCLQEPSGFSEMTGIDSRPVTEETSSLPAPTSHLLKEFIKLDSANIAEGMQKESLESKLTKVVPGKPGIGREISMLKANDASEVIEESESVDKNKVSVNTEMGTSDQVRTMGPNLPDTEAVNVTDADQTQTETKHIDATAPLILSSQHTECVPQEDTTLEIQRDLTEAIVHQSSSQSREHRFKHTAEGEGEDQDIKVQFLTSMSGIDSRPDTEETSFLPAPTSQLLKEFTKPDSANIAKEKQNDGTETKLTKAVAAKSEIGLEITILKAGDASELIEESESVNQNEVSINTEAARSDQVKKINSKSPNTEAVNVTDGDQTQTETKSINTTAPLILSSQRTDCVPQEDATLEIRKNVIHQRSTQSQEHTFQHTASVSDLSQSEGRGEDQDIKVQLLISLKETSETLGSSQEISSLEEPSPEEVVDFPAIKHVIQDIDTGGCSLEISGFSKMPGIDNRPVTEKKSSLPAPTSQLLKEFIKSDSANIAEEKQNKCPETKLTEAVPGKPGTGPEITMLKTSDASELIKGSESVDQDEISVNTETGTSDQVRKISLKPPSTEAVNADGDQTQTETKPIDATATLLLSECVPQEDTTLEVQKDLIEDVVHQSSNQSQEFQHTARVEGTGEDQEIKVQLHTALEETTERLGSYLDISSLEVSSPEKVDFPAIKHVITVADSGSCLQEPSGFSKMPGIDRRPVTEEKSSLSAPTSQLLKEFTKPDSANTADGMQNECTKTKLTKAVPGISSEITLLNASDASKVIEESESVGQNEVSVNTEMGTSDRVKKISPKSPNTEAVNVTDGDQTQTETKPIDAKVPLMLSSQHTECVPQEDTMLEIQRDLVEAIVHQSSSHSQEFQHTARVEVRGEDPKIKAHHLTSLEETSETLGSCQDISALETTQTRQHLLEILPSALNASESQVEDSTNLLKDFLSVKTLQDGTLALERRRSVRQNNVELQRCSEALLKGLQGLLELSSERLLRSQDAQPQNSSQLRSLLTKHKKCFQDLGQNLVMVKLLHQKLPEGALQGQAEVEQLISALQDQAQTRGVQMQHSLEEWSQYEEVTERLRKQLDEMETNMSSLDSEPEGDLQGQLQSYERLHKVLKDTRPQVWEVQDRLRILQKKDYCERPGQPVQKSQLLLRWMELHSQLQQKTQSTQKIIKNYDRFQRNSKELEEWMRHAQDQVQKWNGFSDSGLLDSKTTFTQLMEFFKELEVRSAQKASAGAQILQLIDSKAPGLRRRLAQLEQEWTNLTNELPALRQTQQQLLTNQTHSQILDNLTSWLEHVEGQLEDESSRVHCALGSSELSKHLEALKDLKAEITSHQPYVDFLNHQSVEGAESLNEPTNRNELILFAEQLGALNRSLLILQAKIDSKIHDAEDQWQACVDREKRLHCIHSWISQRVEWVRNCRRPESCSQIEQTLQECEETEERLQVKSSALKALGALHLFRQQDGEHPGDQAFSKQVNSAIQDCHALSQQINALKLDLQPIKDEWAHFESKMSAAELQTTGVAYKLELCRVPVFSSEQCRTHVEHLQELERELNRSKTWTQLTEVFSDLKDKLNPYASKLLSDRLEKERNRHQAGTEDVHADLLKAQNVLRLWLEYEHLAGECCVHLNQHWERLGELTSSSDKEENTLELPNSRMQSISALEKDMPALQSNVGKVLEASKLLIGHMKPQSAPLIKSETRLLSRDHVHLGKALSDIGAQVQEELEEHHRFSTELKSIEQQLKNFESIMSSSTTSMEKLKMVLLDLSGLNPNLAALNQTSVGLSLSSTEKERLQTLNAQWGQVFSQATDQHRKMYEELLRTQSFQQKCQCWMELLDKIEAGLSSQMPGDCAAVREQLAAHQRLQVEALISQQLQDALINEASHFLESSQNEDRSHLILRHTQLKARWQGTQQRVQQHGICLEGLMGHWQVYKVGSRRLSKLLRHIEEFLPPAGLAPCSLQQLQCSIKDFEWTEEQLQCHEELYRKTVETGRQILTLTDAQTQTRLQAELDVLKEMWEQSCGLVGKRKALANTITHNWKLCETGLADSALKLEEIKAKLKSPLPEKLEDLKTHMQFIKEDEESLQIWAGGLKELSTMKADVSQYVLPTDTMLLQGQVEELHSQWEELCLKVSLRKQEIADRLNAWIIFNDKNKELCDWLTQMEKKVAHRSENLSIEEMVEKLKKDCMEEINLFSENKSHLKQLGEQLLLASDKAKEAEIHGTLQDVNDRWQHLFDHIEARVKKLTETLVTVQQLDKNMNNLRSWLTCIEAELAKPIHYSICHRDEIQKRLAEQQDLQRDIEQHTERVASVLTLCDVLLRDEDACSSDKENDSIQQTTQRLDQRWRNICSMSLERRLRIEETWRLWCKFQEDYSSFEDWLNAAECSAAEPNSSDVLYTDAKEELQKYEVFQKQVHESLTQLEIINNQYRRLARENRADAASRLRAMVHQGNQRWDALQGRVTAILRRLRHFICQREEFEGTRESLLVWLTEIDLQLTNVENFSESHLQDKMKQLKSFKKEITLNTNKIDALIVFGEGLIQRSCPHDAVEIEDELEELNTYCQEVFRRVARFHQSLTSLRPDVFDGEQSRGTQGTPSSGQPSMCLLSLPQEHSGRETPVSVDSIPLEWDHTGDVGGSSSHDEEDDAAFFSALSGQNWHFQNIPERKSFQLDSSSPTETSTPFKQGYVQLMSECSGSIKSVKRVSMILDDEEQQEEQGLTGLNTADKQSGVIERWELLQAQAVSKEQCSSRDPQQLTSDLHDITSWLDCVTPELDRLQKPETSVSVEILEERVKQLKEMQKTFARYKTMMLSLNLGGRELQQGATGESPELQEGLRSMNHGWTEACAGLEGWEDSLRTTLGRCQEFHEMVHSQLLWLAHAESRRFTVNMNDPSVQPSMLQEHGKTLKDLAEELQGRQKQVSSLQEIVSELLPEAGGEDSTEAREKLHVIGSKLRLLSRQVDQDLQTIEDRLESTTDASGDTKSTQCSRTKRDPSPQRSFFYRVLRAAFPLHLLFLLLLVLACLVPLSEDDYSCTFSNNFARSFHPMLRYTNGPPPT